MRGQATDRPSSHLSCMSDTREVLLVCCAPGGLQVGASSVPYPGQVGHDGGGLYKNMVERLDDGPYLSGSNKGTQSTQSDEPGKYPQGFHTLASASPDWFRIYVSTVLFGNFGLDSLSKPTRPFNA
jgi:hypothetical protein